MDQYGRKRNVRGDLCIWDHLQRRHDVSKQREPGLCMLPMDVEIMSHHPLTALSTLKVCDGRNFGDKYLDATEMSSFCSSHSGSSTQFGFGHGVTSSQKCGECAQIRVPRTDGSYNYMTVMMVDHYTWSMEVGTTEIAYLVDGTPWVVRDRADFEFRIVGDYDCYATFDDNGHSNGETGSGATNTPLTPSPVMTPSSTVPSGSGSSSGCSVSSNWG